MLFAGMAIDFFRVADAAPTEELTAAVAIVHVITVNGCIAARAQRVGVTAAVIENHGINGHADAEGKLLFESGVQIFGNDKTFFQTIFTLSLLRSPIFVRRKRKVTVENEKV